MLLTFLLILSDTFFYAAAINFMFMLFNLIPIPPFDGSRIALAFLPDRIYFGIMRYERQIMFGLLIVMLVLSNFGKAEHCLLAGRPVGHLLQERLDRIGAEAAVLAAAPEKGSIIMLLATDAPLDVLQLGRLARRAGNGLARTGSLFGHGSGDVAIAFSSCQHLPQLAESAVPLLHAPDGWMDRLFQAAAEATEQAIFKALFFAEPFVGRDGHRRPSIQEVLPEWRDIVRS